MKASDAWARRAQRRLRSRGFKVTLLDPTQAMDRKETARMRDLEALAQGKASPDQIQKKNSLFGGGGSNFRIVDYGGLSEAA
jgi:hypothetical protein